MKIKSCLTHKTPLRFLPALVPMLLGHAAFGANTLTPLLNTTVCPGETASFGTVPSGPAPYRFEWRKNGVLMSGQTNSTLVLPNVNSSSAATYSVKLRGHANSVTKSAALIVRANVSSTPLSHMMRSPGGTAVFSTTASGTGPFSYLWKKNGADMPGCTSSKLCLKDLSENDSATYSVIVSDPCKSTMASAILTVDKCFPAVDVMLVIDRSGSMAGQKYTDAKQACSNFVQNLNFSTNADQAGLASYNSSATLGQRLTNNPQALNLAIQSLPGASGNTSISSGLRTGQTELASTRHNPQALPVMVLLSDGLPTGSDSPSNALYTATQAKNAGTRIFTVGLGSDVDPVLMQGIASSPNDYFFTTNSSQLSALFDAISTVICRPPTNIIGPSNLTVCAGSTATFHVTASGCSSFSYQWNKDGIRINGQTSNTLVLTNVPVSAAGLYAVEVTSVCRSATNSATLTVTPPPAINCSENKTVEAGSAWSFDMPTANYEVTVKQTVTNQAGACAFIATRTWQTKDPCQNSAQCSQQVTVVDTTAPVIVCSSNLVLAANAGRCSRSNVTFSVTATDNCGSPTVASIPPSGSTFPVGVTVVTNSATDSHGNSSACTFTVTIYDTENPIIHCPTNLVLSADAGQCGRTNVTFSVTANDNCGSVQVVSVPASGSSFPIGVTVVTNVATDSHGNSSVCTFTVTIQDTEFPSIACPLDKTIEEGNPWTFDEPIVSDNCGTPVVTFTTHTNLSCGNGFSAVRTWMAVDSSGNTATCSQTVNLVDTTAPTVSITSPTNGTVFLAPALIPIIADAQDVNGIIARVEFFSGADKIGQTTNGPQYFIILTNVPAGEYTFTARATDICGNVGTSAPVHISVLTSLPLTVNGPIKLNFQTGFFEQIARVTNPTPFVLSAVGVLAYNLPTAWRVQNTSFVSNSVPGVLYNQPVAPGASVNVTLKYFLGLGASTDASPTLAAIEMSGGGIAGVAGTPVPIFRQLTLPDGSVLINFYTANNLTYYVLYSDDGINWKTSAQPVHGTGYAAQWIDYGPPATDSFPSDHPSRSYSVVSVP